MKMALRQFLVELSMVIILISKSFVLINDQTGFFLTLVACILLFYKICLDGFSVKEYFGILFIVVIMFLIFLVSSEVNPVVMALLFFSMKDINCKKVIKVFFVIQSIIFIAVIILTKIGVLYDDVYYYTRPDKIQARHGYGFGHPNQMYMRFLIIAALMLIIARKMKKRRFVYLMLIAVILALWCYAVTGSRSGFYSFFIFFVLFNIIYWSKNHRNNAVFLKLLSYSLPIFVIGSGALLFLPYNNAIVKTVDYVITGRIALIQSIYHNLPISLFGIAENMTRIYVIDNSYIYMLFHYGLLFLGIYFFAMMSTIRKAIRSGDDFVLLAIVILHLYGFMECVLINPAFNYTILIAGTYFFNANSMRGKGNGFVNSNYSCI